MINCPLVGHLGQEQKQVTLTPAGGHQGLQHKENKADFAEHPHCERHQRHREASVPLMQP